MFFCTNIRRKHFLWRDRRDKSIRIQKVSYLVILKAAYGFIFFVSCLWKAFFRNFTLKKCCMYVNQVGLKESVICMSIEFWPFSWQSCRWKLENINQVQFESYATFSWSETAAQVWCRAPSAYTCFLKVGHNNGKLIPNDLKEQKCHFIVSLSLLTIEGWVFFLFCLSVYWPRITFVSTLGTMEVKGTFSSWKVKALSCEAIADWNLDLRKIVPAGASKGRFAVCLALKSFCQALEL